MTLVLNSLGNVVIYIVMLDMLLAFYFGFSDNSKKIFLDNKLPLTLIDRFRGTIHRSRIRKQIKLVEDEKLKVALKKAVRAKVISTLLFLKLIMLIFFHSYYSW